MPRAKASRCLCRISLGGPRAPLPPAAFEMGMVGRVTPCAPVFCVWASGGQRTARPTGIMSRFIWAATILDCGVGRARHSVRAGPCVWTSGGQRTARPTIAPSSRFFGDFNHFACLLHSGACLFAVEASLECPMSDRKRRIPCQLRHVSCMECLMSGMERRIPCLFRHVSCMECHRANMKCSMSYQQCRVPCQLRLVSCKKRHRANMECLKSNMERGIPC